VEEECDKMEYEGSLMFDEYPDRLMLEQIVKRIYQNVNGTLTELEAEQYRQPPMPPGNGPMPPMPPGSRPMQPPPPGNGPMQPPGRPENDKMWDLINVILNNEMYRRRCRHRRCRRWW
jgi:hypothetical protein